MPTPDKHLEGNLSEEFADFPATLQQILDTGRCKLCTGALSEGLVDDLPGIEYFSDAFQCLAAASFSLPNQKSEQLTYNMIR